MHDPQNFIYFADLPSSNSGVHHPPPGFAPVLLQDPHPVPPVLPVDPPRSPQHTAKQVPSPEPSKEAATVSDEFSGLSLKRVSKALKLISPTTNAPIKPTEDQLIACSSSGSDCASFTYAEGFGRSPGNSRGLSDIKGTVGSFREPFVELPTGSRLRRWICPEPDSPSRTGSSSSSASVASDLTMDKSVGSERREAVLDLDICPSDDSSSTGLVVNHKTRFDLAPMEDDCSCDGIPKGSKLWIWMGKEEK